MCEQFVWSFGGDSDSDRAIEAWREYPIVPANLARITGLECGYLDKEIVQRPATAGLHYRAGFKKTEGGWRMIYFVGGDYS